MLVEGEVVFGTPRSHKRRSMPYPAFLQTSMSPARQGRLADDLLVSDERGRPLITPTIRARSWLDRALEQAEVPPMTTHDLRQSGLTRHLARGEREAVQKMLGHASAAMTLDVYADLFDDDLDSVATRLDHAAVSTDVVGMWSNADRPGAPGATSRSVSPGIPGQ